MNVTLVVTQMCNMDCTYCYQSRRDSSQTMESRVLDSALAFIEHEAAERHEGIDVTFCGGEPLLALRVLEAAMRRLDASPRISAVRDVSYEISTNGTLLTPRVVSRLGLFAPAYYIAFDGVRESYEANRRFSEGRSCAFDATLRNIQALLDSGCDPRLVTVNLVISPNNVDRLLESVLFVDTAMAGTRVSLNVAYNRLWDARSLTVLRSEAKALLAFYEGKILQDPSYTIRLIDDRVRRLLFARRPHRAAACGAGRGCWTILTDGEIVCCSMLAYGRACSIPPIGTVQNGIAAEKVAAVRAAIESIDYAACKRCVAFRSCLNFCVALNIVGGGVASRVPRSICETEKVLLSVCAERIMAWAGTHAILWTKYGLKEDGSCGASREAGGTAACDYIERRGDDHEETTSAASEERRRRDQKAVQRWE